MSSPAVLVRPSVDRAAAILLVVLCASWGLNQVAIKVANEGISPFLQAGLRSVGATILIVWWARRRGVALFDRDGTLWAGLAAGVFFTVDFALFYWGLEYTSASRGAVFLYSAPFFVALGAHFFVPGDRLTRTKLFGLLAAFVGVVVAFGDGLGLPSGREAFGDALCLIAAAAWGATTIVVKATSLARAAYEKTLFYQLAVSAPLLLVLSPLAGEAGVVAPTALVLWSLAYQVVVVAFASYAAWFWLVRHYPASRIAAFTFLTPIFSVGFGAVLLGEPVGPLLLIAMASIAAGIYLVNRSAE